jgi:hypothetical protein
MHRRPTARSRSHWLKTVSDIATQAERSPTPSGLGSSTRAARRAVLSCRPTASFRVTLATGLTVLSMAVSIGRVRRLLLHFDAECAMTWSRVRHWMEHFTLGPFCLLIWQLTQANSKARPRHDRVLQRACWLASDAIPFPSKAKNVRSNPKEQSMSTQVDVAAAELIAAFRRAPSSDRHVLKLLAIQQRDRAVGNVNHLAAEMWQAIAIAVAELEDEERILLRTLRDANLPQTVVDPDYAGSIPERESALRALGRNHKGRSEPTGVGPRSAERTSPDQGRNRSIAHEWRRRAKRVIAVLTRGCRALVVPIPSRRRRASSQENSR